MIKREKKLQRMTHQRSVILEEVRECNGHPTADDIYDRVRKRLPRISLGTVYRNLDVLVSCGRISRIGPEFPQMRFDGNTREHYHITCMGCGRVDDLCLEAGDTNFESLEKSLGKMTKYGVFGHKLEFFGLCEKCRKERGELMEEIPDMNLNNEEDTENGTQREPD